MYVNEKFREDWNLQDEVLKCVYWLGVCLADQERGGRDACHIVGRPGSLYLGGVLFDLS